MMTLIFAGLYVPLNDGFHTLI